MTDTAPDHDRLTRMVRLSASQDDVWSEIGRWSRILEWHPMIRGVELLDIDGDSYRRLTTTESDYILERLTETGPHHLTWEVSDSPFPVADWRSTLSCVAEADGCHIHWTSRFIPAEAGGHLADEILAKYMEIGLDGLAERFG